MSLEAAIEKLTAAVEKNTAVLENFKAGASASKATAAASSSVKSDSKPATTSKKSSKAPSVEDMQKQIGAYLEKGPGERTDRRANLAKVNEHFNVERATLVAEGQRAEVLKYIEALNKGEDPFDDGSSDAGGGDGDEALI